MLGSMRDITMLNIVVEHESGIRGVRHVFNESEAIIESERKRIIVAFY